MIVIGIVAVVTELLFVLAFVCFYSLSFVTASYCELLIQTQECKFVVSIITWTVTIPPLEPMVRDLAAQIFNGKLMSVDPMISITCSFRNPGGSTSYISADTLRIMANDSIYGEQALDLPSTKG